MRWQNYVTDQISDKTKLNKMTSNQIEEMPALLESNYGLFRQIIRDALAESLKNGDAIEDMRTLRGDFYRALSHTLDEYGAPYRIVEEITA